MNDPPQNHEDFNNEAEKAHFFQIVRTFKSYRTCSQLGVMRRLSYLNTLPATQQNALKNYRTTLEQILLCIEANHQIVRMITEDVEKLFENVQLANDSLVSQPLISSSDVDKVQVTLKQIYRDWSSDGAIERAQAYQPILDEIELQFHNTDHKEDVQVLVPGAGLGRLAFEIAKLGFSCQGNEFSLFMLFASNFILNRCVGVNSHTIYPWTQCCDNNTTPKDTVRPVTFPDTNPTVLSKGGNNTFTMVAGDFLEVYQNEGEWDCVVTCFFIDCANNVFTFVEQIFNILKTGGVWINLGPLQYHFSSSSEESSIEPSYEDVKSIIESVGFKMQKEKTEIPTLYCHNKTSMLKQCYNSVFFTCVKP